MEYFSTVEYDYLKSLKEIKCMTCGEKITINKKRKNFKQEQFAELLNVSRQSKTIIAKT